jgi:hypothetical protein
MTMNRLIALALIALSLAGCKDYGQCLTSHVEAYEWMMPLQVGSMSCGNGCSMPIYTYIPMTDHRTVCDRWEFPEGRDN